jgi:hypothetical protein
MPEGNPNPDSGTPEPTQGSTLDEGVSRLLSLDLDDDESPSNPPANEPAAEGDSPKADDDPADNAVDPDEAELAEALDAELGDDPSKSDDDPAPDPETFTLTVDGKEVEVTRDELLKGYSRQADYTRKTQALAEDRKAVEAERATTAEQVKEAAEARKTYAERLDQLSQALDDVTPKEPDWEAVQRERPAEFANLKAQWDLFAQRKEALNAERKRLADEDAEKGREDFNKFVESERVKLHEKMPDLADDEKADGVRDRLWTFAQTVGFDAKEFENIVDHRAFVVLDKAQRYDALVAKGAKAKKKAKPALKAGTPKDEGTRKSRAAKEARARLAKSGSVEDAAASLMDLSDD